MSPTRVAFFGTPDFAVPTLRRLLDSEFTVVGVVTQPDKPRGRGQHILVGPVKRLAQERGLPVLQPDRLRDESFTFAFTALAPEVAVVAAYGKIFPETLLAVPPLGFVNVHASLLPKYRGASPVQRAVMAGDAETGVSIMRIVKELDAGPVFATSTLAIGADDTADLIERSLAGLGADLLLEVLRDMGRGLARETPQDHAAATFAPRLSKEDGVVDWQWPARRIHDHVRGLHPWPHACAFFEGQRLIVLRTSVGVAPIPPTPQESTRAVPGEIVATDDGAVSVACGDGGLLRVEVVQPEGRRSMTAREFMAGRRVRPGQRFAGR